VVIGHTLVKPIFELRNCDFSKMAFLITEKLATCGPGLGERRFSRKCVTLT